MAIKDSYITYWRSKSIYDTKGQVVHTTIDNMFKFLYHTRFNVPEKSKIPVWSPVHFDGKRSKANAKLVYAMVFDIDCGYKYIDLPKAITKDYVYLWHASYSNTEQHNKWRLVLPLEYPVVNEDWQYYWEAGQNFFEDVTGIKSDAVCKDAGRAYYVKAAKDNTYPPSSMNITNKNLLDLHSAAVVIKERKLKEQRLKDRQRELLKNMPKYETNNDKFAEFKTEDYRITKANELGAIIKDGVARKITCPNCSDNSVFFYIDADRGITAQCNHRKSCRWYGFINNL